MTERDEALMMTSIRDFRSEQRAVQPAACKTQSACRVETDLAAYRTAVTSLRSSLNALEAELEARVASAMGYAPPIDKDAILTAVSSAWGISTRDIMRHEQTLALIVPRQVAMMMMYEAGNSKKSIGRYFGMHHTTVIHSLNVIGAKIFKDHDIAAKAKLAGYQPSPVN